MNDLLAKILDVHGGMDRGNGYNKVEATIVSGGGLFALKGAPQDSTPRRMIAWLHEERSSVVPYGAPDQRRIMWWPMAFVCQASGAHTRADPIAGRS